MEIIFIFEVLRSTLGMMPGINESTDDRGLVVYVF